MVIKSFSAARKSREKFKRPKVKATHRHIVSTRERESKRKVSDNVFVGRKVLETLCHSLYTELDVSTECNFMASERIISSADWFLPMCTDVEVRSSFSTHVARSTFLVSLEFYLKVYFLTESVSETKTHTQTLTDRIDLKAWSHWKGCRTCVDDVHRETRVSRAFTKMNDNEKCVQRSYSFLK